MSTPLDVSRSTGYIHCPHSALLNLHITISVAPYISPLLVNRQMKEEYVAACARDCEGKIVVFWRPLTSHKLVATERAIHQQLGWQVSQNVPVPLFV
jgi:hypothetical protein